MTFLNMSVLQKSDLNVYFVYTFSIDSIDSIDNLQVIHTFPHEPNVFLYHDVWMYNPYV